MGDKQAHERIDAVMRDLASRNAAQDMLDRCLLESLRDFHPIVALELRNRLAELNDTFSCPKELDRACIETEFLRWITILDEPAQLTPKNSD